MRFIYGFLPSPAETDLSLSRNIMNKYVGEAAWLMLNFSPALYQLLKALLRTPDEKHILVLKKILLQSRVSANHGINPGPSDPAAGPQYLLVDLSGIRSQLQLENPYQLGFMV